MDLVLNWLWQGSAIALAAAAIVLLTEPSARVRYSIWAAALMLVVMTPIVGLLRSLNVPAAPAEMLPPVEPSTAFLQLPGAWWTSNAIAIGIWAGWAVVHAIRLLSAVAALSRVKRRCQLLPQRIESRLALWERLRTTGRRTRLALSNGVQSAAVFGGPSPIIALAPTLLHELSTEEVDCIVAHEWAHVQRRDDIGALAQAVVRVVAGWHPAVWWLDRRLSAEREHACDEAVVQLTGSARKYATCLVRVAGLSMQPVRPLPVVAMSALGLRARVLRILSAGTAASWTPRRGTSLAAAAALSTIAVSIADVRLIEGASPEPAQGAVSQPLAVAESLPPVGGPFATAAPTSLTIGVPQEATSRNEPSAVAATQTAMPTRQDPVTHSNPDPSQGRMAEPQTLGSEPPQEVAVRPLVPMTDSMPSLREGLAAATAPPPAVAAESPTPWGAAADAGVAIGHGSQKAAVATAGFFSRFGKRIASSF